jgi:hypothetical protein
LKLRGKTTRRTGAEIGAEIMEEKMDRQALISGKSMIGRKAFFRGKGWAVDREASFSYAEIKRNLREGNITAVLPALLVMIGLIGFAICGGLVMLFALQSKIPGLIFLAFCLYGIYIVVSGIRNA